MQIRKVNLNDKNEWARMRHTLWPDSIEQHKKEIDRFIKHDEIDIVNVFILDRGNGKLGGFIELNVRNYAEGSESTKVPYVEGWYVDIDLRGRGYGKQLIVAAEKWALENGFDELASDAAIDNSVSIAAHNALGFEEAERIVCFIKKLK